MMEPSTVLFLAANPARGEPLQLGEECRAIERKMGAARFHDRIRLVAQWAARPCDLLEALTDYAPSVLHFSGHGFAREGLCFQSDDGTPVLVNSEAIAEAMRAEGGSIKLAVLNACFSEVQAKDLTAHIPCVIGMPEPIGDEIAITYSAYVYRALASGKSVARAHQHGIAAIALHRSNGRARDIQAPPSAGSQTTIPTLLTRPDTDANNIYIVHNDKDGALQITAARSEQRAVCILTVKATLREFDEHVLARVRAELRRLSGDVTLEIIDIDEGSVRLTLQLSQDAARALLARRARGDLSEVCAFDVSSFESMNTAMPEAIPDSELVEALGKNSPCLSFVLFVDDEVSNIELFRDQFERTFPVRTASSAAEALAIMAREPIGVVLADAQMPGMTGIELLDHVGSLWPDMVRVIVSTDSDPSRRLQAANRGNAHEYIVKPWDQLALASCIERSLAIANHRRTLIARAEMAELYERDASEQYDTTHIIGEDSGLKEAIALARWAAPLDATVLITGETGTGKELIARLVHGASPRRLRPFVRVNCAAFPENVLESELFGHEQGVFAGARFMRKGRFELASGGTIFLDEIGEMSAKIQAQLLRVLQEKQIERVGGSLPIQVDIRVLASTARDLRQLVRTGKFRDDLYYRLSVIPLHVPALRERAGDIRLLVEHFLAKHGRQSGKPLPIDVQVYDYLDAYHWPGNVRELENMVHRALILAQGTELMVEDFAFSLDDAAAARIMLRPHEGGALQDELKDEERRRILRVLEQCHDNQSRAAKLLGISRRTLVERLRSYGVTRGSRQ